MEEGSRKGGPGTKLGPWPRFVPSSLSSRFRRIYLGGTGFFLLVFLATLWPIHPFFARVHPLVLGMPFSLAYLAVLLIATFLALLLLFLWEGRGSGRGGDSGEA